MTIRLDPGTADAVAGRHEAAAEAVDAAAPSGPKAVDAGYGEGHVLDILAAVCETAGEIALVNVGIAQLVRDVVDDMGMTEAAIATEFDQMARID